MTNPITTTRSTEVINIDGSDDMLRIRIYIDRYLSTLSKREAAVACGFAGDPYVTYKRIMELPEAVEYLSNCLEDMTLTRDQVLVRLGEIARGAYSRYIMADGDVDIALIVAEGKQYLIKSIEWNNHGPKVVFYDSLEAMKILTNVYGMTKPKDVGSTDEVVFVVTYGDSGDGTKRVAGA